MDLHFDMGADELTGFFFTLHSNLLTLAGTKNGEKNTMANENKSHNINRRDFLKLGGGFAAALAGGSLLRNVLNPVWMYLHSSANYLYSWTDYSLAATDGWAYMPSTAPQVPPTGPALWPDDLAPAPFNVYTFGFRDVTWLHTGITNLLTERKRHRFLHLCWLWMKARKHS